MFFLFSYNADDFLIILQFAPTEDTTAPHYPVRPTPTSGPSATFCGRSPRAPATAPAAAPTATGPAPVRRWAAHPSGAASAELVAMRCHSAGISPGRCRARATASEAPRPTAPATAPTAAAFAPR